MTIAPSVLASFVDDIAFVAEEQPAATPQEFVEQLGTASERLEGARINGAEDLETAATYLADAVTATGARRKHLTDQAVGYLKHTADMVGEYRLMI
ncbi:hypothetical protein [Streptomyces sp. NBC_00140]|uniref:hypothetical protein n=1 Tax=Streptomyces sp. NBC_00140 TaxID=2975664 RepID=UPI002258CBCB|nr:hypothetical protein [Streptomyces sp. NBC_00140]MCX5336899.1 hypothetical protein [Streptomyces sp. NBC_00140]MCX5338382.1 hypothetical protein [Streptomyces sp. NBC_00140]